MGVGTNAPTYTLHVSGSGGTTGVGVGTASYGDAAIEVGSGALGSHYSYIDLTGDTTYTDYGVRLIRTSSGANALGQLSVRGTGGLYLTTVEAGPMVFQTSNTTRMHIASSGTVGIGTSSPSALVEVYDGDVRISNDTNPATLYLWGDRANSGDSGTIDERIAFRHDNLDTEGWNIESLNYAGRSQLLFKHLYAGTSSIPISLGGPSGGMETKVGIGGVTDPSATLDISGTVRIPTGAQMFFGSEMAKRLRHRQLWLDWL